MGQTSRWVEKLELELIPAGAVTLAELGKNVINSWHCVLSQSTVLGYCDFWSALAQTPAPTLA